MHAFLIIGNNIGCVDNEIDELSNKLGAKIMPYEVSKVEDIRELNKFLRLSINEKTLIVIRDIEKATVEALNAFLKNLEEPQENLYFALTASSLRKVLPTIVSRCQIIRLKNEKRVIENEDQIKEFLILNIGQRLSFFDKIKDRGEAISFVENLIYYLHEKSELTNMEVLNKTYTRLKANGNVNLHLSNLAINYLK